MAYLSPSVGSASTSSSAPASSALIEYQLIANGPWFVGYTENAAGIIKVKDQAGVIVAPIATRLTGGSTEQGRQQVDVALIKPVQHVIPLSFTVPAVAASLTVAITPGATATNLQYLAGDVVILAEVDPGGGSTKLVRASVVSVSSNAVTVQILARDAATSLAPTFTANAEITGQTRCGTVPATATGATINITAPPELTQVAGNPNDFGYAVATALKASSLLYGGIKSAAGADIDLAVRLGAGLKDGTELKITSIADINALRFVSATPLRFCSLIEITFTKAV
jgi:hypothetical protein